MFQLYLALNGTVHIIKRGVERLEDPLNLVVHPTLRFPRPIENIFRRVCALLKYQPHVIDFSLRMHHLL